MQTLPSSRSARHVQAPRRVWVWPIAVAVGFLLLQIVLAPHAGMYPDSARYAELTYRYLGDAPEQAHTRAAGLLCADRADNARRWNDAQVVPDPNAGNWTVFADCMAENHDHFVPTDSPRYQAIFDSRPGYPLAAAALAPLMGVRAALWAVPVGSVLLAGLGVWWLLRVLGVASPVAAGGQAALYLLPIGTWGVQALTEGPVLVGVVAAMLGAVLLVVGRLPVGAGLLLVGLGWLAVVKYSTALPLAAALAVAAVLGWWAGAHRRGAVLLGGLSAAGTGAVMVAQRQLRLPGFYETAQDTFTNHFETPDVPDVVPRLIAANVRYWQHWPVLVGSNLLLAVGVLVGGWALWRWHRPAAVIVLGAAAVGFAQAVAHPEVNALDRLYVLGWLAPIVGLPVAAWRVVGQETVPAEG